MKKVLSGFIWIISKIIGKKNLERLLIYNAKSIGVNLHVHGLIQIGALNGYHHQIISEQFFIANILPNFFKPGDKPLFFDVGGNVGDYALELKKHFPGAVIHSFEPVKKTFDILAKNTAGSDIKIYNTGFGDTTGTLEIYNTANNSNTEIASVYKEAFTDLFKNEEEVIAITCEIDTMDNFCLLNNIKHIDFLKIDVEGHELSVLKGALNMLVSQNIKVIQFEFNAHNVYSRVFLKDFYDLLKGFEFYRLKQNGMIALGQYDPVNEIFLLQNIVAVRKDVCHLVKPVALND